MLIIVAQQASFASTVLATYKCALTSASPNDPDWKSQAFPLIQTSTGFEAASSEGSSTLFELSKMSPSSLKSWPKFAGGTYYSGNNDVFVIVEKSNVVSSVVKPLETDPNTNKNPSQYNCTKAQ
jgi:hypothetical protein